MSNFPDYNLDERILKALNEMGYRSPTPIQHLAIPKILSGSDIIACAQTGTGKTAAFLLPILHLLCGCPFKGSPSILILAPTRELAMQISDQAKKFSKYLNKMKTVCIYGGMPYPLQKKALSSPYDILVATPGRLIDFMDQGRLNFSKLQMLVLDEADRMLDMGFIHAVEKIAAACPTNRQTLMFSATIDHKVLPFSKKLQRNPVEIRVELDRTKKNNIEQRLYYVDNIGHKIRLLECLLETTDIHQTIVFTSTKYQANQLSRHLLEKGYSSCALHGDMNQRQRTRTIAKMHDGDIRVLVATDVAARGIDIVSLSHVINFDLPHNPEDFIHRIGRTGRAEANGIAITFATYPEERLVSKINTLLGIPLTLHTINGLEPKPKNSKAGKFNPKPKRPNFRNRRKKVNFQRPSQ